MGHQEPSSSGSVTLCEDKKTITEGTSRRSIIDVASERDSQCFLINKCDRLAYTIND